METTALQPLTKYGGIRAIDINDTYMVDNGPLGYEGQITVNSPHNSTHLATSRTIAAQRD